MKKGLLAIGVCALFVSASANAADNPFAHDKATLRLADLDLATTDGQQRLAIRMDEAARAVCGDRVDTVSLTMAERTRTCQASVIADIRSLIETRTASATLPAQIKFASR